MGFCFNKAIISYCSKGALPYQEIPFICLRPDTLACYNELWISAHSPCYKSRFPFFLKEKMWPGKATARLGHACGCSLRTTLGHQLAKIFLADGYLVSMLLSSYSYCICISLKSVTKDISGFCLSSCSCNIHWIWLKYLLASTEVECKQHLYTSNRYSINLGM